MKNGIITLILLILVTSSYGEVTKKQDQPVVTENVNSVNNAIEELQTDENHLIKADGVGVFIHGKQIPSEVEGCIIKKETKIVEEGNEEPIYFVSENGEKILSISPKYDFETERFTDNIGEIGIFSDKFKTTEGIGVNSSIEDFIDKYPHYTIWYTYVSDMYVIDTKQYDQLQFILDGEDFIGKKLSVEGDRTELKLADFKKHSKIQKIRIM